MQARKGDFTRYQRPHSEDAVSVVIGTLTTTKPWKCGLLNVEARTLTPPDEGRAVALKSLMARAFAAVRTFARTCTMTPVDTAREIR